MKKFTFFRYARLIFIALLLADIFLLYGCTTFGTFSSLKQNISTSEDVRVLLGEPDEVLAEEGNDIWKYRFGKPSKTMPSVKTLKMLETEIYFQDGVMTDYNIIVVTKTIPDNKRMQFGQGNAPHGIQTLDPKARRFLKKYDTNKDRLITKKEYFGPPRLFILLDSNHNNIIELIELNDFPN